MFRKCFIAIFVFSCFYSAGIVCVSSDEKSPFCFEAHTFSEAEIESMLAQKKTLNKLQQGIKPTNAELADNAMSLFNKTFGEELASSGGAAALLNNLFQVPGFGFVDTSLTHAGGAIAVVQFMVDCANDKPEAQINLAKNASFWAVGTFNMFSRAVKISAVGVFAIDYALTSLGSTTITGRYDFWYRGYKKFYDEKYGNDMTKWEDLIFGTYKGDMDAFLKDGLMDFWKDAYTNKEYTKYVQTRTFPRKDEQQKMKIQYLKEEKILKNLKEYIVNKRKEEKERLRKTVQNNYDKMVMKMSNTTLFGGKVRDSNGKPIEGAEVRLFERSPVKTNAEGKYEIKIKACELYWDLVKWRKKNPGKTPKPLITAVVEAETKTKEATLTYTSMVPNEVDFTFDVRELVAVQIKDTLIMLDRYDYVQLKATAQYSDGTTEEVSDTVTWNADDPLVVSIEKRKIRGAKKGKTFVYATYVFKDKTVKSNPRKIIVREKKILEKITVSPQTLTITTTQPGKLQAIAYYSDGSREDVTTNPSFNWETNNVSIAGVDKGMIKPGNVHGTCTVAMCGIGDGKTICSNMCTVTVTRELKKVAVPVITGKTKKEAETLLQSVNLKLDIPLTSTYNPAVKPGVIMSQIPVAGTMVNENDTVTATLNPAQAPSRPSMGILVMPEEKRSYPVGTALSFVEDVEKKTKTATYSYIWYLDGKKVKETKDIPGDSQQKSMYSHTFTQPGRHYVQLVLKSSTPGEDDAIIKDIFIDEKVTEQEPAVEVTPTTTVSTETRPQPLAKKINRFEATEKAGNLVIASSYWRGGMTPARWSNPVIFRTIGQVDKHILVTPDATGGYNTGFLVYSPKGSKKLLFEVYAFNFKRHIGILKYSGQLDLHGKTLKPESLNFEKTGSRAVTVSWKAADGSLCKAEIWKTRAPEQGQSNIFIDGGVKDLGCIEPKTLSGKTVKLMCPDDQIWATFPSAEDFGMPGAEVEKDKTQTDNISLNYQMYLKKGTDADKKTAILALYLYGSDKTAKTIWDAMFKMGKNNKKMKTIPPMDGMYCTANRQVFILLDNAHLLYKGMRVKMGEGKPPTVEYLAITNVALEEWLKRLKNLPCSLVPSGLETAEGAEIKEINWGKTSWPIRIQDGVLEVRGSGYEGYTWKEAWVKVADGVKEYIAEGSGAGPILAWTSDGKNWKIVTLHYSSGIRKNPRSFSEPVETIQGAKNGAYLKVGNRCYSYAFEELKEIDCETRRYK